MDPSTQGWQPYPQYAPRPPVNGLSIASLVLGIVCCLPPLGLVLGLISLSQIKKRGERGKGMAVAGTVLSSLSTALLAVALATGGIGGAWDGFKEGMDKASRSRSTLDLRKGDCFNLPGSGAVERETTDVEVVDCASEHEAEVAGGFKVRGYETYPGESRLDSLADTRCQEVNDGYAMDPWAVPKGTEMYYYLPTKESWRLGDKIVTCAFVIDGGVVQGSVRGDAKSLDDHQLVYLKAESAIASTEYAAPEEDFADNAEGYRDWARQTSVALAEQAGILRGHSWPGSAAGPAEERAKEYERARVHWDKAARAQDEDAFWTHSYDGQDTLERTTEISVRGPLGLEATPPADETDETDAPVDGSGGPAEETGVPAEETGA
ncbi:DUF4190 domain-containing protein [Streptomyces lunaelactis]|uniref:DUF4190 domain-containing protein n=1 Tax=Streptomyces lunaelactis TaxID=1535768 RepID=UPI0015853D7B|nr:DUF4190 domain-containing protein [Streptomyces lunaelactis]NUK00601.1 DUF4190 domain-containing protein [Streptomyces lunaelactis]NUK14447.1 DUF4190 domain-containing protein [Streptomyces lunaelactis]